MYKSKKILGIKVEINGDKFLEMPFNRVHENRWHETLNTLK